MKVWDARPAGEQRGPAENEHTAEQRAEAAEGADDRNGERESVRGGAVQRDGGVTFFFF